jgi:hypothetical protein
MQSRLTALVMLLGLSSCSSDHGAADKPLSSERERDSVLGASQLPGAQGVRGALRVSDSGTARRALEDSVGQAP